MPQLPTSGIRLFRLFGIQVYLHWSWIIVAVLEIRIRAGEYSSIGWNIVEYITLFIIVLLHEFGHALACRSVGGQADRIMLWPLGGVAFVSPPQRPGAVLWSIVAGPLVNVVLVPVTLCAAVLLNIVSPAITNPVLAADLNQFVFIITFINILLLAFNILPIYPLDGGQILRSLLWFFVGPGRSLMIAASIGLAAAIAGVGVVLVFAPGDVWLLVMAAFLALQSWNALKRARLMGAIDAIPPNMSVRCPACGSHPPAAPLWRCECGQNFDTFATSGICPTCNRQHHITACPACGKPSPIVAWSGSAFPVIPPAPVSPASSAE